MGSDAAVVYSFVLYILYVLLPLIPAILIFKFFPDAKVTVSGPLQNLTVNATGAFAAYVVTVALGFFIVRDVDQQIGFTRLYALQGVVDVGDQIHVINSNQFYSRYTSEGIDPNHQTREYYFVVLLDHPEDVETVRVDIWGLQASSGVGAAPAAKQLEMKLDAKSTVTQRFRLEIHGDQPTLVKE